MKRILKRLLLSCVLAGVLGACNTIAGFGRDVEKVGDNIERKAEQKKNY